MLYIQIKKFIFIINFLFCIFLESAQAQEDSLSFNQIEEILLSEQQIQGLVYQFEISLEDHNLDLSDLGLIKNPNRPNEWKSDSLLNYSMIVGIQDSVVANFDRKGVISYFIFDKKVPFPALKAYLETMIRNDLFLPFEHEVPEINVDGQLIMKAAKMPYMPFYKMKIKLLNDIKMILLFSILMLFMGASFLLVVTMLIIKAKKHRKEVLSKRFKKLTYGPLSTLLFEHDLVQINEFSKSEIEGFLPKNYISNRLFKEVMIQEIISLNKNMKGDFKVKLKLIYRKLELDKITLKKLKSHRWDIVTMGIVEVNEMDVIEAIPMVENYISDKNFYIRSNAVATLLNLSNDKNLIVLAKQKYPLSKWQQMIYLRIIKYISQKEMVKIIYLLESENESVRIFGIKLVRYLGRVDTIEKLSEMYSTSNNSEKLEILKCYDAFNAVHYLEQVHHAMFSEDAALCLGAINTLKNLGNVQSQGLLLDRLTDLPGFEFKKAILSCLHTLDKTTLYELMEGKIDKDYNKIYMHLEDPVLTYV